MSLPEQKLETEVQRIGRLLMEAAGRDDHAIRPADRFDARVMEWAMADEELKVQLFRFIDVLPTLHSAEDVARHLEEYFAGESFPVAAQWGIHLAASNPIAARAAAVMVRVNAERMARRFIAGAALKEVIPALKRMRQQRMAFTVDLLGEAAVGEAEAEIYRDRYLQVLDGLTTEALNWPPDDLLDRFGAAAVPRVNVSVKLSSLYSQLDPSAPEASSAAVRDGLRPVLRRARKLGAAVTFDMEQFQLKSLTLRVFRDILTEPEFSDWPNCGIALQAYLRETVQDIAELIDWAQIRGAPIGVRLVRGAYWDYETVIARQRGWRIPVYTQKRDTDWSYETSLRMLIESHPVVQTAAASHNVRSLALALALADQRGLSQDAIEVQMLYGMADSLKRAVVELGRRVRVYTPFGEVLPGMAYLVRRLLENTSNSSFLRQRYQEGAPLEALMAAPGPAAPAPESPPESTPVEFRNTPELDFTREDHRQSMQTAVLQVRGQLGREYPAIIGGEQLWTDSSIASRNPARPNEIVGRTASGSMEDADRAVSAAFRAVDAWRSRRPEERAAVLRRAADLMEERRFELAAWEIYEAGKSWREADADVAESIDYLRYYADQAELWSRPRRIGPSFGEVNELLYEGRGVVAVIPPWNFPLAILTGMSSAAIAAGNCVVLKPASQTPVIGAHYTGLLQEAGLPPGVLNYLPGSGREIGDSLVDDPRVAMIAFTGSLEVGRRIIGRAAAVQPGQEHLKYVLAELGGKNAIIVDTDADMDDAVLGVTVSAFGYQGQKCSACSRVICIGDIYEHFLARLIDAARSLRIGSPEAPEHFMGPVIDELALARIQDAIHRGEQGSRLVLKVDASNFGEGHFLGPVVFGEVSPDSSLAMDEIFGPVLSVMRAETLGQALELANRSRYALTGGIYSRSPANLERARREFRVGNLYINRKITGALVGRQPFGGFKMSGTDIKAGGPDYLPHFMLARATTENTLRRGFAPPAHDAV